MCLRWKFDSSLQRNSVATAAGYVVAAAELSSGCHVLSLFLFLFPIPSFCVFAFADNSVVWQIFFPFLNFVRSCHRFIIRKRRLRTERDCSRHAITHTHALHRQTESNIWVERHWSVPGLMRGTRAAAATLWVLGNGGFSLHTSATVCLQQTFTVWATVWSVLKCVCVCVLMCWRSVLSLVDWSVWSSTHSSSVSVFA